MKALKKILCMTAVLMIAVISMTGCAKFDCSGYIQAMLDSLYKGEHTEYARLTKLSEARLQENYEEGINAEIEKLLSYMNVADSSSFVNETTRSNARELFKNIYKNANYSVGEADKKGNVTVTVSPINLFSTAANDLNTYVNDFFNRNDAGEFAEMADEDFYSAYIQGVLDILNRYAGQITYGSPQSVTVRVKANSQNVYSITDDEFLELDACVLDYQQ